MARYHLRVEVDVADAHEDQLRVDRGLAPDAPLLDVVRDEVWEALTEVGEETGRWDGVRVT